MIGFVEEREDFGFHLFGKGIKGKGKKEKETNNSNNKY